MEVKPKAKVVPPAVLRGGIGRLAAAMVLPGHPRSVQPKPTAPDLTPAQQHVIATDLVEYFKSEKPPADCISVVEGTIQFVDPRFRLCKARVRTDVYCRRVKSHISNLRFRVSLTGHVDTDSITFL